MWRKEKLCTQWKSRVIPFAIGRNILQQDTRAERGLIVYSAIILEKGRARGLKLCNYYTRRKKQHRTLHICTEQPLFLNFLNQYSKQTQCALKEDFLLAESLAYVLITLWCFQLYAREVIWYAACTACWLSSASFSANHIFVWGNFV